MLLLARPAAALNPSLDVSQYAHTTWSIRSGELNGSPTSFAQTADGYLWLGTEFGVLRFDGVRFVPWRPPASAHVSDTFVVKLLAGRDGSLWIATRNGVARWRHGTLERYKEFDGYMLTTLLEDRDGTVWAGTSGGLMGVGTLCAIASSGVTCHGQDGRFGRFVISLYEDRHGALWVGAATGLWRWNPGPPSCYPVPPPTELHSIIEAEDGTLLVAVNRGLKQLSDGQLRDYPLHTGGTVKPTFLLRDRHGSVWMGTQDQGLLHVHRGTTDRFSRADGLSGNFVKDLFEDRERNVWVATLNGLDHFREFAVARISSKQGLSTDAADSVLAPRSGGIWIGTLGGVDRWRDGRILTHPVQGGWPDDIVASLFEDSRERLWMSSPRGLSVLEHGRAAPIGGANMRYVQAMAEDASGHLWLSDQELGLVSVVDRQVLDSIPWSRLGNRIARSLVFDATRGGLWLGFFQGGLSFFKDGRISASYGKADGLGEGQVSSLRIDREDALWAATSGGLSRLKNDRIATLTSKDGLPCDIVHWSMEDADGHLWLDTACGLLRIARTEIAAWVHAPQRHVRVVAFDDTDGIAHHAEIPSYSPKVARSEDGLIFFATSEGVGLLDPQHLPNNTLAPPVHIEQVTADRIAYEVAPGLRLPPLVRDLRIDYTAPSLVIPERVRFRYKLEGRDAEWIDAGNRRQAFYTNLTPKSYRFRVIASNNDGVWNEAGATWAFSIRPAFYETNPFKAACALMVAGLTWALYRVHLRRVAAQLNIRFEERLAERTRIARELHDTLLQGCTSASMQLHVAAERLVGHPEHPTLERVLYRMGQVLEEGRQTVQDLRSPDTSVEDLEEALVRDAEEFRGPQNVDIRLIVEGARRPLPPLERDEVYRIVREALTNAFRHAGATRVELELEYEPAQLKVNVRDNGCGIDAAVLAAGRAGHWGLRGMRERAEQLGGRLEVWSRVNGGTDVALTIPSQPPAGGAPSGRVRRFWQTWTRRRKTP